MAGPISLLGIAISIALYVILSFKGFNMFFTSVVATLTVALFSSVPVLESFKGAYMAGFSGFIKSYFLLFALAALYGKLMEDTGAVRRIALSLAKLTKKSKNNQKFLTVLILPVFYFILSYVGISGFVVVFTVVAVGRELFEECDIPWTLYCYGSAGIFPAIIMAGGLQPTNIIAAEGFKTPMTAGFALSIICVIVVWVVLCLLLKMDIAKANKKNEGFLPTGEAIKKVQISAPMKEEDLPNLIIAIIPLLTPLVCIIAFKADVLVALTAAILMCFLLMFKKIKNPKNTLSLGLTAAANPIVNVSAAVGFITLVKAVPGFELILKGLDTLPPLYAAIGFGAIMSAVVASSSSWVATFAPYMIEKFTAAGVSAAIGHRLTTISCFSYMMPHNAGVVNAVSLAKFEYKKAAWLYFKTTTLPGLAAIVVAIVLVSVGIFK